VKERALLVLVAAAFGWTLAADNLPAAQPPGADWSRPQSIHAAGLTVRYPREWTATVRETTITVQSGGTRIMLINYGATQAGYFPARPDHFKLDDEDRRFLSCLGFDGWNVIFTDRGQAVQAFVKLGPGTRKSDAAEVPDRLEVLDRLVG
jgi:hypothetical protein